MDVKELNKKQLILLTLLITFVVSIATGIITVSLMQQMPKSVPQTINNVIQRTIEKVTTIQVPAPTKTENKNVVDKKKASLLFMGDGDALVPIYDNSVATLPNPSDLTNTVDTTTPKNTTISSDNTITAPDNNTNVLDSTTSTNSDGTTIPTTTDNGASSTANEISSIDKTNPKSDIITTPDNNVIKSPKVLGQGVIISDIGLILINSTIVKGHPNLKVILNGIDFNLSILKKFDNGFTILKIDSNKVKVNTNKKSINKVKNPTTKIDNH